MDVCYILEKGTARINEDCLVMEDNIFGVFDGATSLSNRTFLQGKTGGMIASQTAKSVFRRNHYPLNHLACQANREIQDQMVRSGVNTSKKENLWSTSAAVIRLRDEDLEWIQTGDAQILLIYDDGSYKLLGSPNDHDHDTLTLWKALVEENRADTVSENPPPPALPGRRQTEPEVSALRQALAPQIKKVRREMNITYGVLNGEKQAEHFLKQGVASLDGVRDVLLFTDGLSIPQTTPEKQKDFSGLVKLYLKLGLEGLKEQIRKTEETDPYCLAFPRFKCHDDIAAIAVTF